MLIFALSINTFVNMNMDITFGYVECGIFKQKVKGIFDYGEPFVI